MKIERINPDGLHKNPAYSQLITVENTSKTVYIGGQNGVNEKGEIVDKDDLFKQTERALKNIQTALSAVGATFDHVIKYNIYVKQGLDIKRGFEAYQSFSNGKHPAPIITVITVPSFANPDFLVEIDAIAVL